MKITAQKKLFDPPEETPFSGHSSPDTTTTPTTGGENDCQNDEGPIKVEGVRLYSEKYRAHALRGLEPFPEREYEELKERLLRARCAQFSRQTRSGNAYSTSTQKCVVLNRRQHPALRARIDQLLRSEGENRVAVLAYLRAFVMWYTNAESITFFHFLPTSFYSAFG